jgi:hypothetical protein
MYLPLLTVYVSLKNSPCNCEVFNIDCAGAIAYPFVGNLALSDYVRKECSTEVDALYFVILALRARVFGSCVR